MAKSLKSLTKAELLAMVEGLAVEETPTQGRSRQDYIGEVQESFKGSGVTVSPELHNNRYVVLMLDTEHRMTKRDGSVSDKMIGMTKNVSINWFEFQKDGSVVPEKYWPGKQAWDYNPVIQLEDGREVQVDLSAVVTNPPKSKK